MTRPPRRRARAIQIYRSLIERYPRWCSGSSAGHATATGCADEVLYLLGYEYERGGAIDEARKVYLDLVMRWPKSPFTAYAYLAFGELFFRDVQRDENASALAEQSYFRVLQSSPPGAPVSGLALYRLSQLYAQRGDLQRALTQQRKVLEYGKQYASARGAQALASLASRDIVSTFVAVGDPRRAPEFFGPLAVDDAALRDQLDTLARAYEAAGKSSEADAVRQRMN